MADMGRPVELPGAWGEWARLRGGTAALAKMLGVSERTLRMWTQGRRPIEPAVMWVRQVAEEDGIDPDRLFRIKKRK